MAIPVNAGFNPPPPEACPVDLTDVVLLLNTLIYGSVEGDFTPYIVSSATPPAGDQGKVWHKLDANGRPLGTFYFYQGAWRKQYDHRLTEIVAYSGDPGIDFAGPNHLGTVGGEWDGFQLCTGENGSPNLTNKFIVGAKMDDLGAGYPDGGPWKSDIGGTLESSATGATEIALTEDNVPRPARDELLVGKWEADGNTPSSTGSLWGVVNAYPFVLIPAEPAVPAITFPTLPPYYALAYAIFVGYEPLSSVFGVEPV